MTAEEIQGNSLKEIIRGVRISMILVCIVFIVWISVKFRYRNFVEIQIKIQERPLRGFMVYEAGVVFPDCEDFVDQTKIKYYDRKESVRGNR